MSQMPFPMRPLKLLSLPSLLFRLGLATGSIFVLLALQAPFAPLPGWYPLRTFFAGG